MPATRSDSEDSILSHITVNEEQDDAPKARKTAAKTKMSTAGGASARSSVGASSLPSTPPTSLDGSTAEIDASKTAANRRVARARSSLSTLNDADSKSSPKRKANASKTDVSTKATGSRAVSGATLVNDGDSERQEKLKKELGIDMHWDMAEDDDQANEEADGVSRRRSRRSGFGTTTSTTDKISNAASSLGKRARDAFETAKETVTTRTTRGQTAQQSPEKKPKYESTGRLFPGLALKLQASQQKDKETEEKRKEEPPAEPPKPKRPAKTLKKYHTKGLYAGQTRGFNPMVKESTNKKKRESQTAQAEAEQERTYLPLPMFGTYKRLTVEGDVWEPFKLPFDTLQPLRKEQNPKNWGKLNRNRFVGDAEATWDVKAHKHLDASYCSCKPKSKGGNGCDDDCYNRYMKYECTDQLCNGGDDCGNRPFLELRNRSKNKNWMRLKEGEKPEANLFGEGVETFDTKQRGFGVRAMRPFAPNQVVVEYCGEIITLEESDRRMAEEYKGKSDFYLMDFQDGLIIDAGTRGSICRFVNHSCDPNCRVEKWYIDGEPRMALFAGEDGIMTGEELTYDYNFKLNSEEQAQVCHCGAPNCRGVIGPTPKEQALKGAARVANAVTEAFQGVKRKIREAVGMDEDREGEKKKRVKVNPKAIIEKASKRIMAPSAPAVAPSDPSAMQLQKESREQRAKRMAERNAEKAAKEAAEKVEEPEDVDMEDVVAASPKPKKAHRRSTSTTIAVSDLPKPTTSPIKRRHTSPSKRVSGLKDRVKAAVTGAASRTTATDRVTSQTRLIEPPAESSSSKTSSAVSKSMRQSRLSFGTTGFGFNVSPKKKQAEEEDEEDAVAGASAPKIPKRGSSLKADTKAKGKRTSAADELKKLAATARVGLKGQRGMRTTVRAVSGAAGYEE